MNKDRVEGKVKDIAGRVERQVGEWTGDPDKQVDGTAKQVEGKVQNAWGQAKDAAKKAVGSADSAQPNRSNEDVASEDDTAEVPAKRRSHA
jgi:uncharacterized protein YjbJ (UPF0337 family)